MPPPPQLLSPPVRVTWRVFVVSKSPRDMLPSTWRRALRIRICRVPVDGSCGLATSEKLLEACHD